MELKKLLVAGITTVGLSLAFGTASASLAIVSSVGGAPSSGVTKWNFDLGSLSGNQLAGPGGATLTLTPDAALVTGSQSGIFAAPFLSGNNGDGFGSPNQGNGVDTTRYVTTGSTGAFANAAVSITFSTAQQYLGLLWGSVDLYNTLTFYSGNSVVGTLTGASVTPAATGNQGANGTYYVNINSTDAFDRVVFTSSQYAFEFDNVAFGVDQIPVPLPAAAWLLLSGLAGLGVVGRRKKS